MILSYNWLSELCDLPASPDELGDVLTFLGLEVEDVRRYKPKLDHVVIGQVVECTRMEGSDHLSITRTDLGGETCQIVCGAPNVAAGQKVAVMLPGGTTADGMHIKKAKLRGHESHGMICSERELGLFNEHDGILVGEQDWVIGTPASNYLLLDDTCYDVEITPNRPDLLSHIGVARDLAAKFKTEWIYPDYRLQENLQAASESIRISLDTADGCPRYAARVMRGVKIAASPYARRLRLTRCGIRPISNIVDVTNYVMLEFGQPLHAFDARFITGGRIHIRYAVKDEKFVTLDGKTHELKSTDVVIADEVRGIALAGVMGGLNSEIRDDTTDVVIECAYFDPVHIRRTAKRLGISTDSSRRFERGCDPNGVPRVVDAAAALMSQWAGGEVLNGRVDAYPASLTGNHISFRPKRTVAITGFDIERGQMRDILHRLECEVEGKGELWSVVTPTHRPDLKLEIDLVEEVIRVHGYDEIPTGQSSRVPLVGADDPLYSIRRRVTDIMVGLGFHETLSVSMYAPDPRREPMGLPTGVAIGNPVTEEMTHLQGSVFSQMLRSAAANWQRGERTLRLFEVAHVFAESASADPRDWERTVLSAIMTGQRHPASWAWESKSMDFYDLKAVLDMMTIRLSLDKVRIFCYDAEESGVVGEIASNGSKVGAWGVWPEEVMTRNEINASVFWFELDLGAIAARPVAAVRFEPLPRFPISWRDIAVIIDESLTAAQLVDAAQRSAGEFLVRTEPVDVYHGERLGTGRKSVAIRFEFSHPERSLESAEVDGWMQKIIECLRDEYGAELRS